MLVFTVVLGVLYPARRSRGRSARRCRRRRTARSSGRTGRSVGSSLIGQSFTDKKGNALPQWFQSRPSAAGDGYDGAASSGSQLRPREQGPDHGDQASVRPRSRRSTASRRRRSRADAVTASGIRPRPAHQPGIRAAAGGPGRPGPRAVDSDTVRALVETHVQGRDLGYLGEPTVNVLQLNLALGAESDRGRIRETDRHGDGSAAGDARRRARASARPSPCSRRAGGCSTRGPGRRRRGRRDPRPGRHRGAGRGARGHPAPHGRAPRRDPRRDGPGCGDRAGTPTSPWSTSSPTPTHPARSTPSAGRTSTPCSTPGST